MNEHKARLLNVARALRESKRPEKFDMGNWGGLCRTPHCALGHYAVRRDLQSTFELSWFGDLRTPHNSGTGRFEVVAAHFGITLSEAFTLFDIDGCGCASSALEAAEFIENFAAKKWPECVAPELRKLKAQLSIV